MVAVGALTALPWLGYCRRQPAPVALGRDARSRAALSELRDGVGGLITKLALFAATLAKIPSNLPLLVQRHPDILGGLADPAAAASQDAGAVWVELLTRSATLPRSFVPPLRDGTRYAMLAGYRAVIRIFASVPAARGGAAWLRRELAKQTSFMRLPPGSRMALFE